MQSLPPGIHSTDLSGICQALTATRHLLETYRRQLGNEKPAVGCSLDKHLLVVASLLKRIDTADVPPKARERLWRKAVEFQRGLRRAGSFFRVTTGMSL